MDLNSTIAVVTGGASGLGAATAEALAAKGAKVAVADLNLDAAQALADKIGGKAYACDVRDENAVSAMLDAIEAELGTPRLAVNCAGIGTAKRILGRNEVHPLTNFSRVIDVNLIGSFNVLRLCSERMAKLEANADGERGLVIMTASIAAYEGQIGQAAYAASKGGIVSMTLPAARELSQFGIRVLTVAPGLFRTPLMEELPEEVQQSLGDSIPFPRRLGNPVEFAGLCCHCAENSFLNGETIRLDGSLRMAPK